MEKIKFNNCEEIYQVELFKVKQNVIRLTFETETPIASILLSGFVTLNEHNLCEQGLYKDYKTEYRNISALSIELSNDQSIYIEPEVIVTPIIEPVQPTAEELAEIERQRNISDTHMLIENLKSGLLSTDYYFIKSYEAERIGSELPYTTEKLNEVSITRDGIRSQINILEIKLNELIG